MANDGEVSIGTKVDTTGLDKGLRTVQNKVNNTSKDLGKGSKAVNGLKTAFNETGGAAAGFANKMQGVATSGGAVGAGITAAVLAAKKYIEILKEATEAYKVQEKAEMALEKAAENNPYLSQISVQRLKDYASELQKVSNYGDEVTIDIMAQLASTGRTESEIMKIMGAAADYAAAKHIDLKTAAESLNATYSGMAGTMGRQIADIKELTDEQLKNGDAIDLIAEKYKGFAERSQDSSEQAKNAFGDFMESVGEFANPVFDSLNKMARGFWESMTSVINKVKEGLKTARETWVIGGDYKWSKEYIAEFKKSLKDVESSQQGLYMEDLASMLDDDSIHHLSVYLETKKDINEVESKYLNILERETQHRKNKAAADAEYAKYLDKWRTASREELEAFIQNFDHMKGAIKEYSAVNDLLQTATSKITTPKINSSSKTYKKTANDYAVESNKALQNNLYALEVEAKVKGETVSAQDRYNVYLQSYIDLLTKTEGLIKEGFPVEQKRLEQLQEAKKALEEAAAAEKKAADEKAAAEKKLAAIIELTRAATDAINGIKQELTPAEEMQKQIDALEELKNKIKETSDEEIAAAQEGQEKQMSKAELVAGLQEAEKALVKEKVDAIAAKEQSWWDKYASSQKELLEMKQAVNDSEVLSEAEKYEKLKELDEAYKQSKAAQYAELLAQIQDYTGQAVDIMSQACDLMLETQKNEATAEQAELELKYRKGEISEEEYQEKLTESKKQAAREQYKIQMVQWAASLLQATANIAQGVTQAIAQGGVAGLITGALVSAAGGVQIASIIASKPTPPNFSTGGIIGGSSYHGDNIAANLNSREMVMNQSQQKRLWEFINGGSNGQGGGANIVINNSAANLVRAQPQITKDKIELLIDARVNDSLKNGRYNTSLTMAQQGMSGDFYGI